MPHQLRATRAADCALWLCPHRRRAASRHQSKERRRSAWELDFTLVCRRSVQVFTATKRPNVVIALMSHAKPSSATVALRCALVFGGCATPLPLRVASLLRVAAREPANDLDSASADFASRVRELRVAAGFGESPPWHAPAETDHPWVAPLEAEAHVVQAELRAALHLDGQSAGKPQPSTLWDGAEYEAIAPAWRFHHLWRDGEWLPEAAAKFPRTVALLRRLEARHGLRLNPLQNVACGFARQPTSSGIAPHCDGNLLGLTAHLGLQVPTGECWIDVGGERRRWEERRLLLMDTTHTHSTRNRGECDRYILLLNVLRPEVEECEVTLLRHYLGAPPLSLDCLNPGWLVVPPCEGRGSSDVGGRHVAGECAGKCAGAGVGEGEGEGEGTVGDEPTSVALVCTPSSVDDAAARVQLHPHGSWLPQRPQGGRAGVVRFEPVSERRYRVVSTQPLEPRQWPSEAALRCAALAPLARNSELSPCAAAIDADGCLEWIAIPVGPRSRWLVPQATSAGSTGSTGSTAESVPDETLHAHLELLHAPPAFLAWLPVYDRDDNELLTRIDI